MPSTFTVITTLPMEVIWAISECSMSFVLWRYERSSTWTWKIKAESLKCRDSELAVDNCAFRFCAVNYLLKKFLKFGLKTLNYRVYYNLVHKNIQWHRVTFIILFYKLPFFLLRELFHLHFSGMLILTMWPAFWFYMVLEMRSARQ
jgi:hypothetical protein